MFKYTKIMLVINQNVIKEKAKDVFFEINSQKINNNVEIRKERTSIEILEKVLDDKNINLAIKRVQRNEGVSGDKMGVEELQLYFIEYGEDIKDLIRSRKYKPNPVRRVYIQKDNGDKRGFGIPIVVDKVIQQAVVQVLSPIYEN